MAQELLPFKNTPAYSSTICNPEMLKIAADHYPDIKVIATGSSRLSASAKFKDTLAGRNWDVD
jgi:hypothetical protein